ncbi:MAG: hypothetical protein IKU36_01650 [Bacteroidales bacterium]|nr:hypothetical protein [Bacteroidales bacterium]
MQNQRTLETLYTTIYGVPDLETYEEDSLEHHGVLGMSWGRRHGPPYPLGGVDKRVARAEAKRKREKERRLKKLQRAAKKARKLKKREEKEAADIQKKKQKLVKKGDMDAIKKNAKLFTNEELQYIVERDEAKRSILGKKERDEAQAMENFSRKMAQVANIAASAGTILGTVRQGAQMVNDFKATKLKDLEIEDKRRGAIQKEFEMRFGKDDHSPEAQRFIDRALAGEEYTTPKETKGEKAQRKMNEDIMTREAEQYFKDAKAYDKAVKDREKAAKDREKAAKKLQKQFNKIGPSVVDTTGDWTTNNKNSEWNPSKKGIKATSYSESPDFDVWKQTSSNGDWREWTRRDELKEKLAPRTKWSSASAKSAGSSESAKVGERWVINGQKFDVPNWYDSKSTNIGKKTVASFLNSPEVSAWSSSHAPKATKVRPDKTPGQIQNMAAKLEWARLKDKGASGSHQHYFDDAMKELKSMNLSKSETALLNEYRFGGDIDWEKRFKNRSHW